MHLQRFSDANQHLFDQAFALYEASFPPEERRDRDEQARVMGNDAYHMDFIMEQDTFLGVMLYWETPELLFLEHFTILPQLRNQGIGSAALQLLKEKGKTVILEIEPPVDDLTRRRYAFYCRNGFSMNDHYHIQAKYHLGDEDLELKILSCPGTITREQYTRFITYMTQHIGILPRYAGDITVRPLAQGDDLLQVAKLIYLSDPYIYPYWFDSMEDGQKVIAEMIDLPTLYNRKNITVAVTPEGTIAGALVGQCEPVNEDEAHLEEAFRRADIPCDHRTHTIFRDYYEKMADGEPGLYLSNLAVDPAYRNRGIAAALLREVLKNHTRSHLECVQANIGAWRLYQRLGYEIAFEYPGVFDVPCYKMRYCRKG